MKASKAKQNVRASKKKAKRAKSNKARALTGKKRKANLDGQADAANIIEKLYNKISIESKQGCNKLTYSGAGRHGWELQRSGENTGNHYFQGMAKVIEKDLTKNGYVVKCNVKGYEEEVWHGSMSDMVPSYHFRYWYMTIKVEW